MKLKNLCILTLLGGCTLTIIPGCARSTTGQNMTGNGDTAQIVKKALQERIAILKLHEQNVADAKTAENQSPLKDLFKRLEDD